MPVFVLEMAHLNPLWKYSVGWKSARVRAAWSLTSGVTLSRRVRVRAITTPVSAMALICHF